MVSPQADHDPDEMSPQAEDVSPLADHDPEEVSPQAEEVSPLADHDPEEVSHTIEPTHTTRSMLLLYIGSHPLLNYYLQALQPHR